MTKTLFLDDDPYRQREFRSLCPSTEIVSTADDCIGKLKSQEWDVVFLDHDLGGEQYVDPNRKDTGAEVVRWVKENMPKVGCFIVHSHNYNAAYQMVTRLAEAGYNVQYLPFIDLPDSFDELIEWVAECGAGR